MNDMTTNNVLEIGGKEYAVRVLNGERQVFDEKWYNASYWIENIAPEEVKRAAFIKGVQVYNDKIKK